MDGHTVKKENNGSEKKEARMEKGREKELVANGSIHTMLRIIALLILLLTIVISYGVFEVCMFRREFAESRYWPKTIEETRNIYNQDIELFGELYIKDKAGNFMVVDSEKLTDQTKGESIEN